MHADLDALLTALYVRVDDLLPKRQGPGRPPRITDAELIALAVAQMFLGIPNDRQFLALAAGGWGICSRICPKQPGYNKRLRALAPDDRSGHHASRGQLAVVVRRAQAAGLHPGAVRPVARDGADAPSSPASAAYGWCKSHSRYFWGFRLYLLCAADGMPIAFELAPANTPEREVAAEMLARVDLHGYTVIADKGFAGEEFEQIMARPRRPVPAPRPQRRTATQRVARTGPPMDRVDHLDLQRPALARTPRRPHHPRRLRPHRTPTARPRRRPRPQPTNR